jgi:hypothetical protein
MTVKLISHKEINVLFPVSHKQFESYLYLTTLANQNLICGAIKNRLNSGTT